jgi:hypothetical protein
MNKNASIVSRKQSPKLVLKKWTDRVLTQTELSNVQAGVQSPLTSAGPPCTR